MLSEAMAIGCVPPRSCARRRRSASARSSCSSRPTSNSTTSPSTSSVPICTISSGRSPRSICWRTTPTASRGHCLLGPEGRVWAIDNGLCFAEEYKLRTVIWEFGGEQLSGGLAGAIQRIVDAFPAALGELLHHDECQALCANERASCSTAAASRSTSPVAATPGRSSDGQTGVDVGLVAGRSLDGVVDAGDVGRGRRPGGQRARRAAVRRRPPSGGWRTHRSCSTAR